MSDEPQQPETTDWYGAILTLFWGVVLTYFFFEPIKEFVSSLLKALL